MWYVLGIIHDVCAHVLVKTDKMKSFAFHQLNLYNRRE